jgi:hypothetical protein
VQARDRLLHPIIVDREALNLGLEFAQPGLFPLSTLESGCDTSARCRAHTKGWTQLDTARRIALLTTWERKQ